MEWAWSLQLPWRALPDHVKLSTLHRSGTMLADIEPLSAVGQVCLLYFLVKALLACKRSPAQRFVSKKVLTDCRAQEFC